MAIPYLIVASGDRYLGILLDNPCDTFAFTTGSTGPAAAFGVRQRFAVDHLEDAIHAGIDARVELALFEQRHDVIRDDALGDGIRQRAFEAAPHFDAQLAFVLGNYQDRAVVNALAAELPFFADLDAVLLDGFRLRRGQQQHRNLPALALLERCEFGFERRSLLAGERGREIGDARL